MTMSKLEFLSRAGLEVQTLDIKFCLDITFSKDPMLTITRSVLLTRSGKTRAVFEAWTKSEAFWAARNRAEDKKPLYLDHPQYEGFEVRQTMGHGKTAESHECKLQPQFGYEHRPTRSIGTKV